MVRGAAAVAVSSHRCEMLETPLPSVSGLSQSLLAGWLAGWLASTSTGTSTVLYESGAFCRNLLLAYSRYKTCTKVFKKLLESGTCLVL